MCNLIILQQLFFFSGETEDSTQENISQVGVRHSNLMQLSPDLASSAPNILQPLDLNSRSSYTPASTPSPLSPYESINRNVIHQTCRRSLQPREERPFSDFFGEEFVPLDENIMRSPYNNHTLELCQQHNVQGARDIEDGLSLSIGQGENINEDDENDSTSIENLITGVASLERSENVTNDQHLSEGTPCGVAVMETSYSGEHVVESQHETQQETVELTEDSPLRILEESEIVHEQEAIVEAEMEGLLVDETEADQQESMETDDSDSVSNSEENMFETSASNSSLTSNHNEQAGLVSQEEASQILDEVLSMLNSKRTETSPLLEEDVQTTLSPLPEGASSVVFQPEPTCVLGPSVASTLMHSDTSNSTQLTEEKPSGSDGVGSTDVDSVNISASAAVVNSSSNTISLNDSSITLVEAVEKIVNESQSVSESDQHSLQLRISSELSPLNQTAVSRESFPMEEVEPMCLDMASLNSGSASQLLVATPTTFPSSSTTSPSNSLSSPVSSEAAPDSLTNTVEERSPQGAKRVSRSKSEPHRSSSKSQKSERGCRRVRQQTNLSCDSSSNALGQETSIANLREGSFDPPVALARRVSLPTRTIASTTPPNLSTADSASDSVLVVEAVATETTPSASVAVTPILSPTLGSSDVSMASPSTEREAVPEAVVARPVLVSRGASSASGRLGKGLSTAEQITGRERSSTLPVGRDLLSSSPESDSSLSRTTRDESVIYATPVPSSPKPKNNASERRKLHYKPSRDTISSLLHTFVRTAQVTQGSDQHVEPNIIETSAHPVTATRGHRRVRVGESELADCSNFASRPRRTVRNRQRTHPVHLQIQDQQHNRQQQQQSQNSSDDPLPTSKCSNIICSKINLERNVVVYLRIKLLK